MAKRSAGILPVRLVGGAPEVMLVHPGGPFFRKKDLGAWSVVKGLLEEGEEPLAAAQRELVEETGFTLPAGPHVHLGQVVQKGGKRVDAYAVAADFDVEALVSDTFELEWPPRSGRVQRFPEVDRAAWLDPETARAKILEAQRPFVERACAPETLAALGLR
ncbi:MAG: NUDIX domain-containing protein [Sandaracinaceae bacterium]|nr:MAG: NUDIX domain-containing protein [Sandaracinaceae bacterium]